MWACCHRLHRSRQVAQGVLTAVQSPVKLMEVDAQVRCWCSPQICHSAFAFPVAADFNTRPLCCYPLLFTAAAAVDVAAQVSRSIVEGVELLDRQLRAEEPIDTIMTGIKQLQDQLQKLVDQAQPPQ